MPDPNNPTGQQAEPVLDQIVGQLLSGGLEEVSPPGGITHRAGEPWPRQHTCTSKTEAQRLIGHLRVNGGIDVKLGADEFTVWWMDPPGGRRADAGFDATQPIRAGHWQAIEERQREVAAGARALEQAMDDLLEYQRSLDRRAAGEYTPDRFAQEIIGLGRAVDAKLGEYVTRHLEPPSSLVDARVDMYLAQGEMEDCAGFARDAEALFYDIQAHTAQVEWDATQRLMMGTPATKPMSETAAKKAIDTQDEAVKRHATLVRMAGRVKARALDLYAISRRRLRTQQKCVDTFTGKGFDD